MFDRDSNCGLSQVECAVRRNARLGVLIGRRKQAALWTVSGQNPSLRFPFAARLTSESKIFHTLPVHFTLVRLLGSIAREKRAPKTSNTTFFRFNSHSFYFSSEFFYISKLLSRHPVWKIYLNLFCNLLFFSSFWVKIYLVYFTLKLIFIWNQNEDRSLFGR